MSRPRLLSLCSGIGCIDLAAVLAGFEIAGQVEINPFCQAVLKKNFPHVLRKADLKEVQGDEFGPINIVAGGIPCQPFSKAGKRKSTADDRYLWPEMLRIVKKARPDWVVIENVDDFARLALDVVQADLEALYYTVQAFVLPACAVGAPHIRERCFVVAYSQSAEQERHRDTWHWRDGLTNASATLAYTTSRESRGIQQRELAPDSLSESGSLADPCSNRWRIGTHQQEHQPRSVGASDACIHGTQGSMANASSSGWQEQHVTAITGATGYTAWRKIAPGTLANPEHGRYEWGSQHPNEPDTALLCGSSATRAKPESRVGRIAYGFASWLDGHIWPALPGYAQHSQEPPRTIQGKQQWRRQRLEALGNAVVWQQIYPIFDAIMQHYAAVIEDSYHANHECF